MTSGAKLGIAALAAALGLVLFLATRGGEGRAAVDTGAREVASTAEREQVELEAAQVRGREPERRSAPTAEPPTPVPRAEPPPAPAPPEPVGFALTLSIEPFVDVELIAGIGAWEHDPSAWLRGSTHPRDRRGSLLQADERDGLLERRLQGPTLVELRHLPFDTPFWISVTPEDFRAGGLHGFPPLLVAHPPVRPDAVPDEPLELKLSPLGGVRGQLPAPKLAQAGRVRHAQTRTVAMADPGGNFVLWPLPPGEVRLDVFLQQGGGVLQIEVTALVEPGRITDLGVLDLEDTGVHWSGVVVDDRSQPVGGTLSAFSLSGELVARFPVDPESGAFAWRGLSYPSLRLAFTPRDAATYEPSELLLVLPHEGPLKLVAPRRQPPWVNLWLERPILDWEALGEPLPSALEWTLEGAGVSRSGSWEGSALRGLGAINTIDWTPPDRTSSGAPDSDRPSTPRDGKTHSLGVGPPGPYTLFLRFGARGVMEHRFVARPDAEGNHVEGPFELEFGSVRARGELLLTAGGEVQSRGAIEVVVGLPGSTVTPKPEGESGGLIPLGSRIMTTYHEPVLEPPLGPGPFDFPGLPTGPLQLTFVDAKTKLALGSVTLNGKAGETVELGGIELDLP